MKMCIKQDLKSKNKPLNIRAERRTFQAEQLGSARFWGCKELGVFQEQKGGQGSWSAVTSRTLYESRLLIN